MCCECTPVSPPSWVIFTVNRHNIDVQAAARTNIWTGYNTYDTRLFGLSLNHKTHLVFSCFLHLLSFVYLIISGCTCLYNFCATWDFCVWLFHSTCIFMCTCQMAAVNRTDRTIMHLNSLCKLQTFSLPCFFQDGKNKQMFSQFIYDDAVTTWKTICCLSALIALNNSATSLWIVSWVWDGRKVSIHIINSTRELFYAVSFSSVSSMKVSGTGRNILTVLNMWPWDLFGWFLND